MKKIIEKYFRLFQAGFIGINFITNIILISFYPKLIKEISLITFISSLLGSLDFGGCVATVRDQKKYLSKNAFNYAYELVWISVAVCVLSLLFLYYNDSNSIILMCLACCPVFAVMGRLTLVSELLGEKILNLKLYTVAYFVNAISLVYYITTIYYINNIIYATIGFIIIRLTCFILIIYISSQKFISIFRSQVFKISLSDISRQWSSAVYGFSEGCPRIVLNGSDNIYGASALYLYELAARSVNGFSFFYNIFLSRMKKTRNYIWSHIIIIYAIFTACIIFCGSFAFGIFTDAVLINNEGIAFQIAYGLGLVIIITLTRYLFEINKMILSISLFKIILSIGPVFYFFGNGLIEEVNPIILSIIPITLIAIILGLLYKNIYPKFNSLFTDIK